ncbi:MAG: MMPL family transporter [SAR324 cluster bacterium]|nr:MMPL family transporter [SAR324 cluster bacterium]
MATLRDRIDTGFSNFGRIVFRHRIKTIVLMLILIGAFVSQIPKITFDTTNESYFHDDDPTIDDYNAFREQFGREETIIIAITPDDVFDRAFLERLTEFHGALEDHLPYVDDVTSLVNIRDTRGEGDELIVEDLLKTIPDSPESMERLKQRVISSPLYRNFVISGDGRMTTVVVETIAFSPGPEEEGLLEGFDEDEAGANGGGGELIPLTVGENREFVRAVERIVAEYDSPQFPLHMTGGPAYNDFFERTMQEDMGRFLSLAVLAIAIFLFVLFRRIYGVVLPLMVVILSLLSTVGLMAATGVPFTIPTTILPSFLLATGVGASVHLLAVFFRFHRQSGDKEGAIVQALGHSGLPIVMTGLTTSAGLFAFSTSGMAPVAHLGIFGGTGVLISLAYTLVLMPALLAIWPVRKTRPTRQSQYEGGFDRLLIGIADFATSRAKGVVITGVVIITVAAAGLYWLSFSMNFLAWMPDDLHIKQSSLLIDEVMKGSAPLEVVIDTGIENGLYEPEVMNEIAELTHFAEAYTNEAGVHFVGKAISLVDVLKETHKALNENRTEYYRIPDNRALIAQELLLFENSGTDDLERVVDSQFSKARLSLILPNDDAAVYVDFVAEMKSEAARLFGADVDITVTGTLNLFTQLVVVMMRDMATSYLIAGVVITLMMILLIGNFRLGMLSMIANFAPILITLGIVMGFGGIRLDVFNLTIGAIALGLAVDDTIHFFHNFRKYYAEFGNSRDAARQTLLSTGRAMIFTTLVLVTGFWLFMFATLNNIFNFGLLTGLTLIFALVSDFVLAPAMLTLVTETRYGRQLAARWSGARVTA